MALIEGPSLTDWMEGRTIHPRKAAVLVQKVALALDAVHAADIVHRDIKPSNIMIDPSGEPVLMDFGLSRQTTSDSHLTHSCSFLGTFAYMSPEQAKGDGHTADQRTDIYSLGVILFQLVTGELPFRGSVQMLLRQVVEDAPPSPRRLDSHIPRDLETICLKCFEKEPRRRYSSARELAELFSSRRIDKNDKPAPIGGEELENIWQGLREKFPKIFTWPPMQVRGGESSPGDSTRRPSIPYSGPERNVPFSQELEHLVDEHIKRSFSLFPTFLHPSRPQSGLYI